MSSCRVKLMCHTPNPEALVAAAARLCYSPAGVEEIAQQMSVEETQKFLSLLLRLGHESPVEHVTFTFAAEGISRVLTHQLVRHRLASYSQQSQRYVRIDDFRYIVPPSIQEIPEAEKLYHRLMQEAENTYAALTKVLEEKTASISKETATAGKKAIEDARYVLPHACETKIVFTMNARSLYNFFQLRCCSRAQWEIRAMAKAMLLEVKRVAPTLFARSGPACLGGPCPEGKMSCGKQEEVRREFNAMSRDLSP